MGVGTVLPESQPTHIALKWMLMKTLGTGFIQRLLPGIKEGVLMKRLACLLTPVTETSSGCPRTANPRVWVTSIC